MRLAVIADVHANVHALDAVLERLEREKTDARLCLGDIVGYNARPAECIARLRERNFSVVMGNHDYGVAHGTRTAGTNATAQRVMTWTRARLEEMDLAYLASLPREIASDDGYTAVHGSFLEENA